MLYGLYNLFNLVNVFAVVSRPRSPLVTVDMSQVSILVGPFIPYPHSVLLQVLYVGVAIEEPQEFVYDWFQVQLLCGQAWETVLKVEAHLMSEDADGARAGSVILSCAFGKYSVQ